MAVMHIGCVVVVMLHRIVTMHVRVTANHGWVMRMRVVPVVVPMRVLVF